MELLSASRKLSGEKNPSFTGYDRLFGQASYLIKLPYQWYGSMGDEAWKLASHSQPDKTLRALLLDDLLDSLSTQFLDLLFVAFDTFLFERHVRQPVFKKPSVVLDGVIGGKAYQDRLQLIEHVCGQRPMGIAERSMLSNEVAQHL